jgi:hypothetical protein
MVELKKVTSDNIYETIHGFITTGEVVVEDYDSMIEVILSMIKGGYCFAMDRDILRDAMESLTYMYAPSDDMNKDRLVQQFADDDDVSDEEEEEDFGNMDLMKMMQMMGGAVGTDAASAPSSDATPTEECKMVTTDEVPNESSDTTIVKDDSAPVAEEPITDEPVTEAPVAEAPVAEAPVAEAPVAEAPVATEETGGAE